METIAQRLDANLVPQHVQGDSGMPTRSLDACMEYLRGMKNADIESVASMHAAIENFRAAIDMDPGFALAYVGLADAYRALAAMRQAVDEGWRLHTWYYLDIDPNLQALRQTPEFELPAETIRADLVEQARNVQDLKASGELASLHGAGASPR